MFQSFRYSQLVLRIGLALVFLWFGVNKFIMPQYWADGWLPQSIQSLVAHVHISPTDAIFLVGIFEVLVAVSLVSGFFMQWFSSAAAVFLLVILAFHGINEILVQSVGLIGGLVCLVLWPKRTYS